MRGRRLRRGKRRRFPHRAPRLGSVVTPGEPSMVTWLREISRDADAALQSDVQQTCQNLDKESIPQDNRCSGRSGGARTNVQAPMHRRLVGLARGRPSDLRVRGRRSSRGASLALAAALAVRCGLGLSPPRTSRLRDAAWPVCSAGPGQVSLSPAVRSFNGGAGVWLLTNRGNCEVQESRNRLCGRRFPRISISRVLMSRTCRGRGRFRAVCTWARRRARFGAHLDGRARAVRAIHPRGGCRRPAARLRRLRLLLPRRPGTTNRSHRRRSRSGSLP